MAQLLLKRMSARPERAQFKEVCTMQLASSISQFDVASSIYIKMNVCVYVCVCVPYR